MHRGDCGQSAEMAAAAESTPELSLSSARSNPSPVLDLFMPIGSSQQAFLPQTKLSKSTFLLLSLPGAKHLSYE